MDYLNSGKPVWSFSLFLSYNMNLQQGGRPFKSFNYMVENINFLKVVHEGWNTDYSGTAMFQLGQKLKVVKGGLKSPHHKEIAKLEERNELLRHELDGVQSQLFVAHSNSSL